MDLYGRPAGRRLVTEVSDRYERRLDQDTWASIVALIEKLTVVGAGLARDPASIVKALERRRLD